MDTNTMDSVSGALHITYGSNPNKANKLALLAGFTFTGMTKEGVDFA